MKLVWTDFAIRNLKDIFDYYSTKVSKQVAHKIRRQILNNNHRYLVSGNHKLIYRIVGDEIIINDVFDTRQNLSKMNDEKRIPE